MIRQVLREILRISALCSLLLVVGILIFNVPIILAGSPAPIPAQPVAAAATKVLPDPTLIVPALGVQAPIIFSATDRDSDVLPDLLKGVSHSPSTAMPGEKGNVFIVGHSSNYPWEHGNYNRVFSYLNKLEPGNKAYIDYHGKRYEYTMISKKQVWPNDYSVMAATSGHNLSLMTCYPVNTTIKRLVVLFELTQTYE